MKALILGCGPAGLMAAHAAHRFGFETVIVSKARKSFMNGAQYLHAPIPGASLKDPFIIDYKLVGDVAGYRDKVYGPGSQVEVSPQSLIGHHPAWDIREAYDHLWRKYGAGVRDVHLNPFAIRRLLETERPDLTISTIPAKLLCHQRADHTFVAETVWATSELEIDLSDNTVLCNGEMDVSWYRASKIQGFTNTEWPGTDYPMGYGGRVWEVVKPLSTSCTCLPEVHRMGRYGKWIKGVLSHHAWEEAVTIFKEASK